MPPIAFVITYDGVGKAAPAVLIACKLAAHYDVTAIYADPNRRIEDEAMGGIKPAETA